MKGIFGVGGEPVEEQLKEEGPSMRHCRKCLHVIHNSVMEIRTNILVETMKRECSLKFCLYQVFRVKNKTLVNI